MGTFVLLWSFWGESGVTWVTFGRPSLGRGGVAEMQQFGLPTSDTVGPQSSALLEGQGVAGCQYLLQGQNSQKWGRAAFPCPLRAPPQAVHRPLLLALTRSCSEGTALAARGGEAIQPRAVFCP